jgi:hypothetical protein
MVKSGLTMVTFSLSHYDIEKNKDFMGIRMDYKNLIGWARSLGLLVRCSLLLSKEGICNAEGIIDYVEKVGSWGAHMVVVREIWRPASTSKDSLFEAVSSWNFNNWIDLKGVEDDWISRMGNNNIEERQPLPWGQKVYVVKSQKDPDFGVNVTFARCNDAVQGDFLKSIVHKPDGHGYRNWDSNGDILY